MIYEKSFYLLSREVNLLSTMNVRIIKIMMNHGDVKKGIKKNSAFQLFLKDC